MSLGQGRQLKFLLAHFKITNPVEKPVSGATITVRAVDSQRQKTEITLKTDDKGDAIFSVPQSGLPQLPMDAEYDVVTPNGTRDRGNVRVGGNEHVHTKTLVLHGA